MGSRVTHSGFRARPGALWQSLVGLFPLTAQGSTTLAAATAALIVFAYGAMDLVVFALAVCTLAILTFSLVGTLITGLLLRRTICRRMEAAQGKVRPVEVEAGYPNATGFRLADLRFLPLFGLDWKIVYPDCISTRVEWVEEEANGPFREEQIVPHRRCFSTRVVRRFSVYDVLGFCRFSWTQTQHRALLALPQTHQVRQLPLLRSLATGDGIPHPGGEPQGDRMEIRPYVPGDPVRNILWKVFARNRQLNVRLPEKSVLHSTRTLAYFLSSTHDEAAAAVARLALDSGALGDDWQFGADGSRDICTDRRTALQALARSRALDEPFVCGLEEFLQRSNCTDAHCIVFAAAEHAPWLAQVKRILVDRHRRFSVVLATDGMHSPGQASLWRRLLLARRDPPPGGANPAAGNPARIRDLLTEIGQSVESMLVVDRMTGASFDRFLRKLQNSAATGLPPRQ